MSLNSSALDAFYVCAQLGSFTRAAERLHVTQSALSQRIMNLERDLEVTLFIRGRAGLKLTEEGELLLRYCGTREVMESEFIQTLKRQDPSQPGQLEGVVRIGAYSSVARSVVLPALSELLRENPAVQLKLETQETYDLPSRLKSIAIDFMILNEPIVQEGLAVQNLGYEKNIQIQKIGYLGPDQYLDHDESDLTTARYLKKKSASGIRRSYLGDIYGIIDGVKMGLGKAIVPQHLISKSKHFEIVDPHRTWQNPVVLHYFEQPYYSRLHLAVVSTLQKRCPDFLV